jgi:hypothetical protein
MRRLPSSVKAHSAGPFLSYLVESNLVVYEYMQGRTRDLEGLVQNTKLRAHILE